MINVILDKYLNSIDNAPSGLFVINNDGEFIYANKAFLVLMNKEKVEDIKSCKIR